MGPVSGLLWLAAAAVAVVCRFSRAPRQDHDALFWGLVALTVVYSVACITRLIPWERVSIGGHALAIVALQPLIVAALWLTGGAGRLPRARCWCCRCSTWRTSSRPATPGRWRAGDLTYASPLVTSSGPAAPAGAPRAGLRRRLRRPRGDDPVPQAPPGRRRARPAPDGPRRPADRPAEPPRVRRGALDALAAGGVFTVLLADIDFFKQINDRFGHTTGDRVLRELAAHASAEVRSGDCLARIGGDEFALVAPGAGRESAERLADALRDAGAARRRRRRAGLPDRLRARLPAGRRRPLLADARPRPPAARDQGRARAPRDRAPPGRVRPRALG